MNTKRLACVAGACAALAIWQPAEADTLENLERERAIALETLLSPDLSPMERERQMALTRARLVDLERMVIRDEELRGKDTLATRTAFQNYDLTFLVHAAAERNRTLLDHWLDLVGVSTNSLMSTRLGRR